MTADSQSSNTTEFYNNTTDDSAVRPLISLTCERLAPFLRSLLLFGSFISVETRREGSIPDLFALVDDVDASLERLKSNLLARRISPYLPPTTVSLAAFSGGPPIAKLNLIEPTVLSHAIATLPDLYLVGRLSKRSSFLHVRDASAERELTDLIQAASAAVAACALLSPPRRFAIDSAVRRCFSLSYLAEIRPETPSGLRARFDVFAPFYFDRFIPLLAARAAQVGISGDTSAFIDSRPGSIRRSESIQLASLLFRSRLRSMARWPKQALVYRGWLSYVAGKIRRSRRL